MIMSSITVIGILKALWKTKAMFGRSEESSLL